MNFKDEDIKYFISREWIITTPKQVARSGLFLALIFGLPTAIFGMHSNISKAVMVSIIIVICVWSILLLQNRITSQNLFNLYSGVIVQSFSVLSLITGFRELSQTTQLSPIEISLIITLYLLCIIVNLLIIVRLIKKGYYRTLKKPKNYIVLTSIIGAIGVVFGRRIFGHFNQDTVSHFMGIFFIVSGFYFTVGTTNFLRYYL